MPGEICWLQHYNTKKYKVVGNEEGAMIVGPVFAGIAFHVASANFENEYASFINRVVGVRDQPQDWAWDELQLITDEILPQLSRVEPMQFEDWVATFEPSKRKLLQSCYDTMAGKIPSKKMLKRYNCFIKREVKLSYPAWQQQKWITPRNIMAAADCVKIILGVYFRAYSKYCHSVWASAVDGDGLYYEPGGSAEEVTSWVLQNDTWPLIENDFSRFDRTNGYRSTQLKIHYAKMLGLTGEPLRVYSLLLERSKFSSRNGARCVRIPGTLSGHPDTTWSNTMVNLTVQLYCVKKAWANKHFPKTSFSLAIKDVRCPLLGRDVRLCACGDDSIGRAKACYLDAPAFCDIAKTLGFKMKMKSGHNLREARFCSNAFYPVEGVTYNGRVLKYLLAPTMKCLLKIGVTISQAVHSEDSMQQHMRGVALGLLKQTSHVPLLNDYIQMVLHNTSGVKGKVMRLALKEASLKYRRVDSAQPHETNDSITYLAEMYRVTVGTILDLRQEIQQFNLRGIYNSTAIEEFVAAVARVEDLG